MLEVFEDEKRPTSRSEGLKTQASYQLGEVYGGSVVVQVIAEAGCGAVSNSLKNCVKGLLAGASRLDE